jgi:uncharacterized protein YkvS
MKVGDIVKYRDLSGEVKTIMDDMVIVKLPDGKEYSLPYDSLKVEGATVVAPSREETLMSSLRPLVKNVNFLNDLAALMSEVGVYELHIKAGSIQAFSAKESLEEKKARYKAEAIAEAEARAQREFDAEKASV